MQLPTRVLPLHNAKKETLGGGGGYLKHLEREASERMRRVGV
ncbi:MAG: hypothetical protein ACYDA0_12690 [Candidatus Dormibacteraceae bacterium]